ncbi:MAG: 3-hydroxyisobutyrate dehydrogenase, partial [Syntrophaceae bacterium]|nr:3-hydroxyisobutyrate dehydrogenase [Syntrophaceae bacterium]
MKIGFIGLGNMGNPMARNLIQSGHELVVYDIVQAARDKLTAMGAKAASSAKHLASEVELVITMLPSAPQVKEVCLAPDGIFAGLEKGVRIVDSSTIDPFTARELSAAAANQGNPMLDAPVSGGTGGAEAGTLTFMVGGQEEDYRAVKPILSCMGKNIVHCGPSGNGQVAKVCNNLVLAITMLGVCEGLTLGVALNMDPKVLTNIFNTSSARCWSSDTYNPYPGVMENVPAARGYTRGFASALMLKDLGLAMESARLSKQPVFLGALAQQLYQMMVRQGNGQKDFSGI